MLKQVPYDNSLKYSSDINITLLDAANQIFEENPDTKAIIKLNPMLINKFSIAIILDRVIFTYFIHVVNSSETATHFSGMS